MSSNLFLNNHPEVKASLVQNSTSNYSLAIEPLYPGYGYTIGNSLRRIFLSSIPGFGVTKIKINDLTHEYQPVSGLVEDALQVILNIKNIRAKIKTDEERVVLSLSKNTPGKITGADFKSGNAEIINKDIYICTLNTGSKLDIEIEVSRGVGYRSMDDVNLPDNKDPRQILVDTIFTPVTNVSLDVTKVRVGDKTNFDKVDINFDMDGSVDPIEVVNYALDIVLNIMNQSKSSLKIKLKDSKSNASIQESQAGSISEIQLPEKIRKILSKNNINTDKELKERINEVGEFIGIGSKAVEDIQSYIKKI
jgi:DNA-directed RNA polymerase subunit alpha